MYTRYPGFDRTAGSARGGKRDRESWKFSDSRTRLLDLHLLLTFQPYVTAASYNHLSYLKLDRFIGCLADAVKMRGTYLCHSRGPMSQQRKVASSMLQQISAPSSLWRWLLQKHHEQGNMSSSGQI
jgi:hypothetical protein